jgi:4-amino-4-deoxy-L-arabinose transferase-like glycosyltransferase
MKKTKFEPCWILIIILASLIFKCCLLLLHAFPFNSDEAIVALMARHILQGARPIFFYGQAYMGSLDAYLVALFFWVFGQSVWVIRIVQSLLFCGTIYTTYKLGKNVFKSNSAGLIAGSLVAIPTVNTTLYTTVSLGGYGETLLFGNLILLLTVKIYQQQQMSINQETINPRGFRYFIHKISRNAGMQYLGLGLLIGLGAWTNGLTLVYSIPAMLFLFCEMVAHAPLPIRMARFFKMLTVIPGFFLGSIPLWIFLIQSGPAKVVNEFFGSAVAVEGGSFLSQAGHHLLNFLTLGISVILGFRPSWTVMWLILPLIPFLLFFWIWVIYSMIKSVLKKEEFWKELVLISSVMGLILVGFIFTSFGVDPSGRYFLPFTISLGLIASWKLTSMNKPNREKWKWGFLALILVYNITSNIQCLLSGPEAFTSQFDSSTIVDHRYDHQLIQFLENHNINGGYSNYWISYPIDFLSNEGLIFVPMLPYHSDFRYTSRDNRYIPYNTVVENSQQIAYITAHFPALDVSIRKGFAQKGITWEEEVIGDYRIFYNLSGVVRPNEILPIE